MTHLRVIFSFNFWSSKGEFVKKNEKWKFSEIGLVSKDYRTSFLTNKNTNAKDYWINFSNKAHSMKIIHWSQKIILGLNAKLTSLKSMFQTFKARAWVACLPVFKKYVKIGCQYVQCILCVQMYKGDVWLVIWSTSILVG